METNLFPLLLLILTHYLVVSDINQMNSPIDTNNICLQLRI